MLVVGCGSGQEAAVLSDAFACEVIGIDNKSSQFLAEVPAKVTLIEMDAQRLDFPNDAFDFVYSFHALEHIADPGVACRRCGACWHRTRIFQRNAE